MRIEMLEYALAVAQEKSFSRAAARLHLTQPSLSQSINSLEQSLGYKLFNRTTKQVSLTDEGEVFMENAQRIMSICQEQDARVSDINQLKTGHITVGVPNFRGTIILPQILPRFMEQYPGVSVSIVEASSIQLEDLTARGQTDLTIINLPIRKAGIEYETICNEELLIAAPPGHPLCKKYNAAAPQNFNELPVIDLKDLHGAPFVVLKKEHRLRQSADRIFQYAKIEPDVKLEVNGLLTAQQLVAAGIGFSLFGKTAARFSTLSPQPVYFRMETPIIWTLVVAYPEKRYMSRITKEFIRIVKESLSE